MSLVSRGAGVGAAPAWRAFAAVARRRCAGRWPRSASWPPDAVAATPADDDQVREAVGAYAKAVEARNARGVCDGVSRSVRRQVLRAAGRAGEDVAGCVRVIDPVLGRRDTRLPKGGEVVAVRVRGDRADVDVQGANGRTPLVMVREDDRWRIGEFGRTRTPDGRRVIRIPTDGMAPTLKEGAVVALDDGAYRTRRPRVGDVVAFHPPRNAEASTCPGQQLGAGRLCVRGEPAASPQTFVKRVVAGPGDRVAIRSGHVVRNGRRADEPTVAPCGADGAGCDFPDAITVPAGSFYLLGDNRGESADSRFWGAVPAAWIVGRVEARTP
jgi:signal peptidase I